MSAPVDYIQRTREQYAGLGYPPYRWVVNEQPPPLTPVVKPLRESRVALIASGGVYVRGQVAFHFKDDSSYRIVPRDVDYHDLRVTHFAYDLTDARADPNVVFPLETLLELADEGYVGEVSPHAYTFMGGIYSARRVEQQLAPALTNHLRDDEVDLAILVPV